MTAYTHNTGAVINFDALSAGSVNATLDTHDISAGSTLVVRTDTYACANHSVAAGSLDTVTFSGQGGALKFDPTYVRVVAYTAGSGTSPAYGAPVSQGGVSGVFLGCWSSWLVEPIVAGAAIGATGYMKIGGTTGGEWASGAITGIALTCSGPSVQGWIEVRGPSVATITVPRVGRVSSTEAWFELGTTNGARNQIIACPTTATVVAVWAGVWIESASGSGVYERYGGVGTQGAQSTVRTTADMKIIWQTTAGIRIGHDGATGVGYLPPAGCKVRIPATILTNCTRTASGSGIRILPTAVIATRQELVTTGAGYFDLRNLVCQWYMNLSQAFYVKYLNCAISDTLILSEVASPLDVDNCIVGMTQSQVNTALSVVSCFAGGSVQNSTFWRFSLGAAAAYTANLNYITGVTFTNNVYGSATLRTSAATGAVTSTQPVNCTFTNEVYIGGRGYFVGAQGCAFSSLTYYDHTMSTTTSSANPMYALEFTTGGNGNTVSGFALPLPNNGPYNGLVSVNACYNTLVKEIGTSTTAPLVMTNTVTGVGVTGAGNNDGITIKRMFLSGTRTGAYLFVNSDNNILVENCMGDYADTTVMAGLNAIEKNVGMTSATTGQVSVYGSHWKTRFTSASAGFAEVTCNEPTATSGAQCWASGGTPQFNSSGSVLLTKVGDQVTWEMPFFAVGYTAFTNSAPTITGTNVTFGTRWGNHDIEFQVDTGAGYGATWLNLTAANLIAKTFNSATGFRLKLRATCAIAAPTNAITNMRAALTTTSADQQAALYPLSRATVSVTDLVTGSRVKATKVSDGTVLFNGSESLGAISFSTDQIEPIRITARKGTNSPFYQEWVTQLTPVINATTSATALQVRDDF